MAEVPSEKLKTLVVFLPMEDMDDLEAALKQIERLPDPRVTHAWDGERHVGDLFGKSLGLSKTAWDVYLVYPPGVTWDEDGPPMPPFWMHQLDQFEDERGADPANRLDRKKLKAELERLVG